MLPRSFVPASGLGAGLTLRAVPIALPRIEVALLWHRRHERDPAQRWLRETVAEVVRGLGVGALHEATLPHRVEALVDTA